jgi:hypothetical protein
LVQHCEWISFQASTAFRRDCRRRNLNEIRTERRPFIQDAKVGIATSVPSNVEVFAFAS